MCNIIFWIVIRIFLFFINIASCGHFDQILFLAFLMVYSLFLMHELRPYSNDNNTNSTSISTADNNQSSPCQTCCLDVLFGVGCLEIATYACVFSYLLEEIRQVVYQPPYWQLKRGT